MLYEEGKTAAQQDEAHQVLDLLTTAYPGHPWAVRVDDGIIFIRHLAFNNGNWGMNLKTREVDHDAAVLRRKIIILAGEWLERAGMARGRYDADQEGGPVEGVPQKSRALPPDTKLVIQRATPTGAAPNGVRETPRPQVIKNG